MLRSLFELAQPGEELDKETAEGANHALSPRHLVLLQGFEIPGGCGLGVGMGVVRDTGCILQFFKGPPS